MSSPPELSRSQISPSFTSTMSTLISPFFALFIESHRAEQVVKPRASKVSRERELLLDNEVYISIPQVVKKKQLSFWTFANGEEL